MDQRQRIVNLHAWQAAHPGDPFFPEEFASEIRHFTDRRPDRCGGRGLAGEFAERVRSGKDLVRVSEHALPAEVTDLVHDFGWTGPAVGQIAAVKDQIGSYIPKILQNRFESRSISVDVGQDRDTQSANDLPSYRLRLINRREPGSSPEQP